MAKEIKRDLDLCNLLIKFFLFTVNVIVWLLGIAILALGIYVIVLSSDPAIQNIAGSSLSAPGIVLVILGVLLVVIGFCGWLGALREIFVLLVVYCILMSIVVLIEVGVVVAVFLLGGEVEAFGRQQTLEAINGYQDDPTLQNLIDQIQMTFTCCGFDSYNDWDKNLYFSCNSTALQKCGTPFSCCVMPPDTEVINYQCGYSARNDPTRLSNIHQQGCLATISATIMQYSLVLGGIGIGLIVLELINIFLSLGLAVDVYRQKQFIKTLKQKGLIK